MLVLWKGRAQGHLRAVCRNTNTHETEKDADEPSPKVTVEAVWCMAVQDTVEDDHCDHSEKHEGISEHRDGSNGGKVITNIETGQNSEVITNVETGQNSEEVITNIETGQNSEEVITNVEAGQNS